jgi:hypothetical protein
VGGSPEALGPPRSNRWWALVGVVGVLGLGWLVTQPTEDPTLAQIDGGSTTTTVPGERSGTEGVGTGDAESEADSAGRSEAAIAMQAEAERSLNGGSRRTTTTAELDRAYHVSVPGKPTVGPVFGESVGYSVFVGDSTLLNIDLDTGEVTEYDVRGRPVHADEQWLVLLRSDGSLMVVSRDDPEGPARRIETATRQGELTRGPEPSTVWTLAAGEESLRWRAVSLTDGSVTVEIPTGGWFFSQLPGPQVSSSQGGGVFVLEGGAYRRLADGIPLAGSDRSVLLRRCASPTDCEVALIDANDGSPVDRALPPIGLDDWSFRLSNADRLLVVAGPSGARLLDLGTGAEVLRTSGHRDGMFTFSPEGRFALALDATPRLYDSETGALVTLEVRDQNVLAEAGAVFVVN